METDEALGEAGHVFAVPKVRNVAAHTCSKPVELLTHVVRLFVPEGGVLLDPFAGSAPLTTVATETGRCAVLVERG